MNVEKKFFLLSASVPYRKHCFECLDELTWLAKHCSVAPTVSVCWDQIDKEWAGVADYVQWTVFKFQTELTEGTKCPHDGMQPCIYGLQDLAEKQEQLYHKFHKFLKGRSLLHRWKEEGHCARTRQSKPNHSVAPKCKPLS